MNTSFNILEHEFEDDFLNSFLEWRKMILSTVGSMRMSLHFWKHEDQSAITKHEDHFSTTKNITHLLEIGGI